MTTLRTLVPGEVSRLLVEAAADRGITVNELRDKRIREQLVTAIGDRRATSTTWSQTEKGLDWVTRQRSGVRDSCKACGAPVQWVESVKNDKAMPIDPLPHPNGNLRIERRGSGLLAHVVPKSAPRPERAYRTHFATCPAAGQMRRRGHLRLVADRPAKAGPDGRRYPDSQIRCPADNAPVAQALVDAGIRRHLGCGLTPEEEQLLEQMNSLHQEGSP